MCSIIRPLYESPRNVLFNNLAEYLDILNFSHSSDQKTPQSLVGFFFFFFFAPEKCQRHSRFDLGGEEECEDVKGEEAEQHCTSGPQGEKTFSLEWDSKNWTTLIHVPLISTHSGAGTRS